MADRGRKNIRDFHMGRLQMTAAAILGIIAVALILRLAFYIGGISRHHLNDDGLTHAIRFQNSAVVHGIDVSEYQDDINWKKVKSGEADFVFVRAGYRSAETGELFEDADFKKNIKKAHRAGLMTGAYFYSQALNEAEAEEEAAYLIELVEPYDIDMPLAIDFEFYEGGRLQQAFDAGELSYASAYHDIVLAFCSAVRRVGYEAVVYANYDMLTNYMDSSILDDDVELWAAQYNGTCSVKGNYMYWQCAEDAEISGIKGPVDHDIWYVEPGRVYSTQAAGLADRISIGECSIEFDEDTVKLSNHRAKPKTMVTYEGKALREGKDYELSYIKNTVKGTGYAVVRGTGKYKDWTAVPFTIE